MSHLKKPLTLTYFFLLLALFVAYRVGAFDFKLRQQEQQQQSQSAQDTILKKTRAVPYTMSSSKSMVLAEPGERKAPIQESLAHMTHIQQMTPEQMHLMSSSKSGTVVTPLYLYDLKKVRGDTTLVKDTVKKK
ncbi:MAG: hypothetical protein JWO03_717 [Bacteroidetes bacterium]|nr:hypothetical protein [Bacteroidota bacterium]